MHKITKELCQVHCLKNWNANLRIIIKTRNNYIATFTCTKICLNRKIAKCKHKLKNLTKQTVVININVFLNKK